LGALAGVGDLPFAARSAWALARFVFTAPMLAIAATMRRTYRLRGRLPARTASAVARAQAAAPACLMIFDILHLDGTAVAREAVHRTPRLA
jgi:ATP-dependent DNA ligase